MKRPPRVLLFDLGGVLVETTGLRELPALLPAPMPPDDLRRKWVASSAVAQFETGECSQTEFAAAFVAEWSLHLTPDDFLARFASWVVAPFPGTGELLEALQPRHTLACLSNTNALHWERLQRMNGLGPVLERPFVSHRLGIMKPSPAVYAHVARELACEPAEIAFFDDGPENIEGAARAGLSAHLIGTPGDLPRTLAGLGLL